MVEVLGVFREKERIQCHKEEKNEVDILSTATCFWWGKFVRSFVSEARADFNKITTLSNPNQRT